MDILEHLAHETGALQEQGLYKAERTISSPQDAVIELADGREVINLCRVLLCHTPDAYAVRVLPTSEHHVMALAVRSGGAACTVSILFATDIEAVTFLHLVERVLGAVTAGARQRYAFVDGVLHLSRFTT